MSEPVTPRSGKKKKRLSLAVDPSDLSSFPWAIVETICSHLSERDVSRLTRVCTKFRSLTSQESVWKNIFNRRYYFLEKKDVLLDHSPSPGSDQQSPPQRLSKYLSAIKLRWNRRCLFVHPTKPISSNVFRSIFDAMMEADDGDMIFIAGGVYEEHISVSKSVEIVGTGPVIIRPIGYHCDRPLMIAANGARVANIRFHPLVRSKITIAGIAEVAFCDIRMSTIWISPTTNAILRRCSISAAEDVAITADGAHTLLEYNQIFECRGGVSVWSDEFSYGSEIELSGNQIFRNKGSAVVLRGSRVQAKLVGNDIYANDEGGVKLLQAARLRWSRNKVHDNSGPGFVREGLVESEEYNILEGNKNSSIFLVACSALGLDNLNTSTWFVVLMAVVFALQILWKTYLQPFFQLSKFA